MSLHISTASEVFCKSPALKCGHQMTHKAASEICVWWRTKSKLKGSWSFSGIGKGRLHRFPAAQDNTKQTLICLPSADP